MIAARRSTAAKRKRRLPKPPRVPYPMTIALDYLPIVKRNLTIAHALVTHYLLPALPGLITEAQRHDERTDASSYVDALNAIVERMHKALQDQIPKGHVLETEIQNVFGRTNEYAARGLQRQIKGVLGFDVLSSVPGLDDMSKLFVKQNVSLITSVATDYLDDIEQTVLRAFRSGLRSGELADMLTERYGVAENRAALIAQDQIGKLNGELVQDRQTALGIDSYIWSTSEDERVRPEHEDRDGVSFEWDSPPEDGNPGQPIRCRCTALPDLSKLGLQ